MSHRRIEYLYHANLKAKVKLLRHANIKDTRDAYVQNCAANPQSPCYGKEFFKRLKSKVCKSLQLK